MRGIATSLVILAGIFHVGAFYKEVFGATGLAHRLVGLDLNALEEMPGFETYGRRIASLIWNQGVYNGFLAAGLLLSFLQSETAAWQTRVFLSACIVVAGLFGGVTVNSLLFAQAGLGALTLAAVLAAGAGKARTG